MIFINLLKLSVIINRSPYLWEIYYIPHNWPLTDPGRYLIRIVLKEQYKASFIY